MVDRGSNCPPTPTSWPASTTPSPTRCACSMSTPSPSGCARVDDLTRRLAEAGAGLRAEQATRLPGRPGPATCPAAPRLGPGAAGWALAGNAAFIAAPRTDAGRDLGCRTFLHSHDWTADPDAVALETIMTGPLVVASWINLQYYFSTVDPHRLGAGTKTVHTVLGDALGVSPDPVATCVSGLPLQSVDDGTRPAHDPLRLAAVVHARTTSSTPCSAATRPCAS
ncbi:putative inorganic carbon transporter subunit DabA [Micromonospora sp. BRA006-A]|nr:putative inorganic carbon transporter subunit DabA [Micromonospora sp. BRA006-A]